MARTVSADEIAVMNAEAITLAGDYGAGEYARPHAALREVAMRHGFELRRDVDDISELWVRGDEQVNLWTDAPTPAIGTDGLGFDAQIERHNTPSPEAVSVATATVPTCCQTILRHFGDPPYMQPMEQQSDGTWALNSDRGWGCYVAIDMRFCPYCGKPLPTE